MHRDELIPEGAREHPWGAFLYARVGVIHWMREHMKRSDAEIALHLSMDETQVYMIRTGTEI